MTDIVERLHKHADIFEDIEGDLMREAADEVERLRAAVEESREAVKRSIDRLCAASQWQPISEATAGDEFLVWNGCRNVSYFNGKAWIWMGECLDPQPTLFQPLPSPPTQEGGEAIDTAIAAEREACAKIADEFARQLAMQGHGSTDNLADLVDRIAAAIRARGKT